MIQSVEEIIQLIKEDMADVRDINTIPRDLPFQDKTVLLQARQEIYKTLELLLGKIEGKESTGKHPKDKFGPLTPQ